MGPLALATSPLTRGLAALTKALPPLLVTQARPIDAGRGFVAAPADGRKSKMVGKGRKARKLETRRIHEDWLPGGVSRVTPELKGASGCGVFEAFLWGKDLELRSKHEVLVWPDEIWDEDQAIDWNGDGL